VRRRRDLHALIVRHGLELVARASGVSVRALLDLRSGRTPLTIDHLLGIARRFRDFDLDGTVARIGAVRIHAGRSRLVDHLAAEVPETPDPLPE
jgi:transcriptional regulator with XRE-family HTH domain